MSTFVGKILVIVITAVSLLFLGISTVAYSTSKNWLTAFGADQKKIDELKKKLQTVQQDAESSKKGLDDAKAALVVETKNLNAKLASLEEENKTDLEKINSIREQLVTAQKTARETLVQVQAKRQQIDELHQEQAAVDKQANEFRLYQTELTDRIHELERLLETANKNHSDLKKPAGKFAAMR